MSMGLQMFCRAPETMKMSELVETASAHKGCRCMRQHRSGVVHAISAMSVGAMSVPRGVLADDVHAGFQPRPAEVADEDMQVKFSSQ